MRQPATNQRGSKGCTFQPLYQKGGISVKKQSNLSRLLQCAGGHRYFLYASWILSAASALMALVPYWFIWRIMREVLETAPDFGKAEGLVRNGWMAVLSAVLAVLVYIGALMCSHMGAHQRTDVDQDGKNCRQHCHPAVSDQPLRLAEIRRRLKDLPHDPPDKPVGYQRHQGTCG